MSQPNSSAQNPTEHTNIDASQASTKSPNSSLKQNTVTTNVSAGTNLNNTTADKPTESKPNNVAINKTSKHNVVANSPKTTHKKLVAVSPKKAAVKLPALSRFAIRKTHLLPVEDYNKDGVIDSDDILEALKEEDNIRDLLKYRDDDDRSRTEQAMDAMITLEIAHQKGVDVQGDIMTVPGRMSITPVIAILIILALIALAASFIHFAVISPNFILTTLVIFAIEFVSIIIYLTASLARRWSIQFLQLLWNIILTGLIDWGYIDHILYPVGERTHYALLVVGLVALNLIPLLYLVHFAYLGRGSRNIQLKRKSS